MSGKTMKDAAALVAGMLGIVGAAAITAASPAPAAPIVPGTAAVKEVASAPVTGASYRCCCCGRRHFVRRFYHRAYARYWRYGYGYADCGYTFPATCGYPYPYFGFVYGWRGIW
jgi:hypothetical protein